MLQCIANSQLKDLRSKARIFVEKGGWCYGVMDETATLQASGTQSFSSSWWLFGRSDSGGVLSCSWRPFSAPHTIKANEHQVGQLDVSITSTRVPQISPSGP